MSKKKIAIFATGWAAENLYQYLYGAQKAVENDPVDFQFADVFNRADALMYENKARMKKQ